MFGYGHETAWAELGEDARALDPGSQAGFAALREAGAKLPEAERDGLGGQMAELLAKRLRLQADREAFPGITRQGIETPIIICGLPRSGTSLLHSLLAEDPANRAPRSWELMTPSPPAPDEHQGTRRIALASEAIQTFVAAMPEILSAHPYWDEGGNVAVECEDIMQMSFISAYFTAFFDLPDYYKWLASADYAAAYRTHHEFLQHLQWNAPVRRWVLKGVTHVGKLNLVEHTYPDACLVWPHRDPAAQFASMVTLLAITRRAVDPKTLRRLFEDQLEMTGLDVDAALSHPSVHNGDILHVQFAKLNRDPIGAIRTIYDRLGMIPSAEHERRMAAWLTSPANDPARHGRANVDLGRFGATMDEVRRRFADYYDSGLLTHP